jgi:hypothetical protein
MRFGIYAEMQTPLDKPHADLTWRSCARSSMRMP